jgi:YggT family protein
VITRGIIYRIQSISIFIIFVTTKNNSSRHDSPFSCPNLSACPISKRLLLCYWCSASLGATTRCEIGGVTSCRRSFNLYSRCSSLILGIGGNRTMGSASGLCLGPLFESLFLCNGMSTVMIPALPLNSAFFVWVFTIIRRINSPSHPTHLQLCRVVLSWYPKTNLKELPWILVTWPTESLLQAIRGAVPPAFGVDITPIVWLGIFTFIHEILLGQQGLLTMKIKYGIWRMLWWPNESVIAASEFKFSIDWNLVVRVMLCSVLRVFINRNRVNIELIVTRILKIIAVVGPFVLLYVVVDGPLQVQGTPWWNPSTYYYSNTN